MSLSPLPAAPLAVWERIAAKDDRALLELLEKLLGPRPPPWMLLDEHGIRIAGAERLEQRRRELNLSFAGHLRGTLALGEKTPLHSPDASIVANLGHALTLYRDGCELLAQRERMRLIAQVSSLVATETDINQLLSRAADLIHQRLDYPNVDIPLYDAERRELVIRIRGGHYKERIQGEDRLTLDQGIMGIAARERRTQRVNDIANDPRYQCPPGVTPAGAELAVPIIHGAELLGVLNVEGERAFDDLDVLSIEVVAEHLAGAIVTARLHAQVQRAAIAGERQRLARELHENVTQRLTSMRSLTHRLPELWQRDRAEAARRSDRVGELVNQALTEMNQLLAELQPAHTDSPANASSSLALRFYLREHGLAAAVERLALQLAPENLKVSIDFAGYRRQSVALEDDLLAIAQEAISNAIKHANARRLSVRAMVEGDLVELIVSDNGSGIGAKAHRGRGMRQMHDGASAIGARLQIHEAHPSGTRVVLRVRAQEPSDSTPGP